MFGIELEFSKGMQGLIVIEMSPLAVCASASPLFDPIPPQDGFYGVLGEGEAEFSSQIGRKPAVSESCPFAFGGDESFEVRGCPARKSGGVFEKDPPAGHLVLF